MSFGTAFTVTSLFFSLATAITQKSFRIFTVKQEKYDSIKLFAQSKLYSIDNVISPVIQDGHISFIQIRKLLEEVRLVLATKLKLR